MYRTENNDISDVIFQHNSITRTLANSFFVSSVGGSMDVANAISGFSTIRVLIAFSYKKSIT